MSDEESCPSQQATKSGAADTGTGFAPFSPGYAFKPPEPVILSKNGAENWKIWKQLYKHYCVVNNAGSQSSDLQKSLLTSAMELEALKIYNACAENISRKLDAHILETQMQLLNGSSSALRNLMKAFMTTSPVSKL